MIAGSLEKHTTFVIKDTDKYIDMKHIAAKNGYAYITDFLWDAAIFFSNKKKRKVNGLAKWQYDNTVQIPTDVFNMTEWKSYIDSCEKNKLHKVNTLASDLIRLTDKRLLKE